MKKLRPENETQEPILQMFYLWNLIDEYYEGIERYQTLKQWIGSKDKEEITGTSNR